MADLNAKRNTEYRTQSKQPRSHPFQHALGVPAPCGFLLTPYRSSCTTTTRVTSLALRCVFPRPQHDASLSASLLFSHLFFSLHASVSGQQGEERISTEPQDHTSNRPVDWRFAPNSLGKLRIGTSSGVCPPHPCRLAPLRRYHPRQQPLLTTTVSSHNHLTDFCRTCVRHHSPSASAIPSPWHSR